MWRKWRLTYLPLISVVVESDYYSIVIYLQEKWSQPEKVLLKASAILMYYVWFTRKTAVFCHLKNVPQFPFTLFRSSHLFKSDAYDCLVKDQQLLYDFTAAVSRILPSEMDMKSRAYITSFIFLFFFLVIQFARWKVSPSFHTRTTSRKRRKGIERRQRDRNSVQQQTSSRTMGISLMIQLTAAFLVGFVITIYMIITHPGKWNTFTVL